MLVIEIPEATPSNNSMMREFAHPKAKMRERCRVEILVRAELPRAAISAKIDCCEINVTRHGHNLLDWDNMGGGLKFYLDALVHWKVITDDKPGVVRRITLHQAIDRRRPRTVFEIVPLKGC